MLSISKWSDLEEYGIDTLTGEACVYGIRVLCDLTEEGKSTVCSFLGIPKGAKMSANWNSKGVCSVMLPASIMEDLAVFALFHQRNCVACFRQRGVIFGLRDIQEDREDIETYLRGFTGNLSAGQDVEAWSRELVQQHNARAKNCKAMGHRKVEEDCAYIRQDMYDKSSLSQKFLWIKSMEASYRHYDDTFRTWSPIQGQRHIEGNAVHAATGRAAGV